MSNAVENESNCNILQEEDEETVDHENFKGIYFQDNNEQQYFEGGAHFSYKVLCKKLEKLLTVLSPDRKGQSTYEDENSTHGSSVVKTKKDSGKITVEHNQKVFNK